MRPFIFAAIGLVIGWLSANAISSGYLQTWQVLPSPPQTPTRLLLVLPLSSLYIQGDNQGIYLTHGDSGLWEQAEALPSDLDMYPPSAPCDPASFPHIPFTPRPPSDSQCLTTIHYFGESGYRVAYALSPDGRIWQWSHAGGFWEQLIACALLPIAGAFLGLLLGVLIPRIRNFRNSKRAPNNSMEPTRPAAAWAHPVVS